MLHLLHSANACMVHSCPGTLVLARASCHLTFQMLLLFAGDDYGPAPDLDHANPELREALKHWLQHLQQDIGFRGWRLDFVRG